MKMTQKMKTTPKMKTSLKIKMAPKVKKTSKKNYETYYRSVRMQVSNKFLTNLKNFKLI